MFRNPEQVKQGAIFTGGMANMLSRGTQGNDLIKFGQNNQNPTQQVEQNTEQPNPFFANRTQIANNQQTSPQNNQFSRFSFRNTA